MDGVMDGVMDKLLNGFMDEVFDCTEVVLYCLLSIALSVSHDH